MKGVFRQTDQTFVEHLHRISLSVHVVHMLPFQEVHFALLKCEGSLERRILVLALSCMCICFVFLLDMFVYVNAEDFIVKINSLLLAKNLLKICCFQTHVGIWDVTKNKKKLKRSFLRRYIFSRETTFPLHMQLKLKTRQQMKCAYNFFLYIC